MKRILFTIALAIVMVGCGNRDNNAYNNCQVGDITIYETTTVGHSDNTTIKKVTTYVPHYDTTYNWITVNIPASQISSINHYAVTCKNADSYPIYSASDFYIYSATWGGGNAGIGYPYNRSVSKCTNIYRSSPIESRTLVASTYQLRENANDTYHKISLVKNNVGKWDITY